MGTPLDLIRAYLTPVTTQLPPIIRDPLQSLLGKECYTLLVEHIDPFTSPQCLKLAISKGIGIGIITVSSIVKIPQLLKILNSKSSAGVSFLSYLLETTAYLISLAYSFRSGFPFSTFGETALIVIQNIIISVLVLNFTPNTNALWPALFVAVLASVGYALFDPNLIDMERLRLLQAAVTIPLGLMSKIPQIIAVFRQGGTGQLSAFAVFNYLFGSLARVFTTLTEVDDKLILYSFLAGSFLNAVLALQMLYYWNAPASKKGGNDARHEEEKWRKQNPTKTIPERDYPPSYAAATAIGGPGSLPAKSGGRKKA